MHASFLIRRGIAAIALVLLSNAGFAADTAKIDQGELVKRMEREDDKLLIVDVRTPEEFAAGHVPGAINIPYTYLPAQAASLASAGDKDIVLYCLTGIRAERAATRLRENGFSRLLHLDGDMKKWEQNKRAIEK